MADSLLTKIARQSGGKLLDHAVGRIEAAVPKGKPGLIGKIAGAALVRIATRSVPGAIVVTGGLIAKSLHDKRKAKKIIAEAQAESPLLAPIKEGDK
jgi:hypothetical protein